MKRNLKKFRSLSFGFAACLALTVWLAFFCPLQQCIVFAETAEVDQVQYLIYNDHAVISKCDQAFTGALVIPSEVRGVPVTAISSNSFSICSGITSITIPDGVTEIGWNAFGYCRGLTSIHIPQSIVSIGYGAFQGCSGLTEFVIPDKVTQIAKAVFSGCTSLTSITIPNGVTAINEKAFSGCNSLTSITIPNSVTTIEERAFLDCIAMETCSLSEQISSIPDASFSGCRTFSQATVSYPEFLQITLTYPENASFLKRITIKNPDCVIENQSSTITSDTRYRLKLRGVSTDTGSAVTGYAVVDQERSVFHYGGTIRGYEGSTAEAYAAQFGYTFESLGAVSDPICGDLNFDGTVSVDDAQAALIAYTEQFAGNDSGLSDGQMNAADVNGDGKLTVEDAQLILIYYTENRVAGNSLSWHDLLNSQK